MVAYARPPDLKVVPHQDGQRGISARVNRIIASGPLARVELIGTGPSTSGRTEYYEAELTQGELDSLALSAGQPVRVIASRLRLFDQSNGAQGR